MNANPNTQTAKDSPQVEPTEPVAWGQWAAAQGWTRGDAEDVAIARFVAPGPMYPGDGADIALAAFDQARGEA